jgi:SH3 domain-containing YSC84-like protein 1
MKKTLYLILALALLAASALPFAAQKKAAEAEQTVAAARLTLNDFLTDPDMQWLKQHFREAKGILIVPESNKGGFIFAGSGGVGVLLTKDAKGRWSQPAFYKLGSVSVGFQIGGSQSEIVLFIQSQKGVDSFLSSSFKFGADASVAAGPVGQGAQTATADVLSFARSKGAFVGAALDGTVVKPAEDLNEGFYGKAVSPVDILVRGSVKNSKADALRSAVAQAAKAKK